MDLAGACAAVEQASQGLAHPAHRQAAEATLLEFRRSPHALPACRHILEHSAVTEAQFQAAATLRDAALRDWSALPHAERVGLRQFCLGAALRTNPVPPPVVLSQLVSTLAVLLKRAWLDDDADRGAMLAEAEAAVASASTSAARRTGLKLFAAVISEFSPSTASPMNLPWDFHERCRASLEADFLLHFFAHGAGIARRCHESGAASTGRDEGVCVAALELMTTALAWDFARGGAGAGSGAFALERRRLRGGGDGPLDKDSKITPGAPWREALLAPGALDWLFDLHETTERAIVDVATSAEHRAASRSNNISSENLRALLATCAASRVACASACALSGDVFPSLAEDPADAFRRAHFERCMRSVRATLAPAPEAVGRAVMVGSFPGGGEGAPPGVALGPVYFLDALAGGARALASLAAIHPPADFASPRSDGTRLLGELTLELLRRGALAVESEGEEIEDVLKVALEAWASLSDRGSSGWFACGGGGASGGGGMAGGGSAGGGAPPDVAFDQSGVPTEIAEGCATVFDAYVRAGLVAVAKAAHDEDDGQEDEGQAGLAALDERLGMAAQVARAAPDATLPLLKAAIDAKKTQLGAVASANLDPTVALEELWWLARLTPHVLADPFDGEIPLPPDALAESSRRAAREGRERAPADELGAAYVDLACLCLDEAGRRAASPRLMETLAWGAARWADTYLMPEDTGGSAHAAVFAGAAMGLGNDLGADLAGEGRVYRGGGEHSRVMNKTPPPFSERGGGVNAVDALLRVALTALTAWPGETGAQKVAARTLLAALTRRKALCRACVNLPSWGALLDAQAGALAGLVNSHTGGLTGVSAGVPSFSFPPEVHRFVCEAAGRAAEGTRDDAQAEAYCARILAPVGASLADASRMGPDAYARPECETAAVATLEALRGVARATTARSHAPTFDFFGRAFDSLLTVQRDGAGCARTSKLVLKLTEEIVAGQACFLGPAHSAMLCRHCLRVVETYRRSGRGTVGSAEGGARVLREERVKEAYGEVKALLRMLTHVTAGDALGDDDDDQRARVEAEGSGGRGGQGAEGRVAGGVPVSGVAESAAVDVAEVVFIGLHAVIPLITEELLAFPKLCHQYFTLLAHMLEAYPAKVAALPTDVFATLMGTLEFGLKHADADVGRESLGALGAMGSFHGAAVADAEEAARTPERFVGRLGALAEPGLTRHNAPDARYGGLGVLAYFMRVVLNRLIFEDATVHLAECAADALLPLIAAERDAYAKIAEALVASVAGDEGAKRAVAEALGELTTGGGLTDKVDRANRRRFRRNMGTFLTRVRSFVRRN